MANGDRVRKMREMGGNKQLLFIDFFEQDGNAEGKGAET